MLFAIRSRVIYDTIGSICISFLRWGMHAWVAEFSELRYGKWSTCLYQCVPIKSNFSSFIPWHFVGMHAKYYTSRSKSACNCVITADTCHQSNFHTGVSAVQAHAVFAFTIATFLETTHSSNWKSDLRMIYKWEAGTLLPTWKFAKQQRSFTHLSQA